MKHQIRRIWRGTTVAAIATAAVLSAQLAGSSALAEESGTVGDRVFNDLNRNGLADPNEPGVADIQVVLRDENGVQIDMTTTDASGNYTFSNVSTGWYTVDFGPLPKDARFTEKNVGTDRSRDSDADAMGYTEMFQVTAANPNVTDIDAGVIFSDGTEPEAGFIGDYVWNDANFDGIQDSDEFGIEGVEITLRNSAGQVVSRTTTNSSGYYAFDDLAYGTYTISVARAYDGWVLTRPSQGTDRSRDSDVDPATGRSVPIVLNDSQPATYNVDVGFVREN